MRGPGRPAVRRGPRVRPTALRLCLIAVPGVLALAPPATAAPGLPDPTFGSAGLATASGWADAPTTGRMVVRAGGGRLLVAGRSGRGDVVLERLDADGTPDSSFGSGGRVVLDLGSVTDDVVGVDVDAQGRTLVGGGTDDTFVLTRLLPDGETDPTYGNGGQFRVQLPRKPFPGADRPGGVTLVTVQAMGVAPNGRTMLAGHLQDTGQNDDQGYALVEVDADGHPIAGFGTNGVSRTALYSNTSLLGEDGVDGIVLDSDGSALVTGRVEDANDRFIRRIRADGTVDHSYLPKVPDSTETFATHPARRRRRPTPAATLATLSDGRYVLARTAFLDGDFGYVPHPLLQRYLASGAPDPSFGDDGIVMAPDIVPTTAKVGPDGATFVLTTDGTVRRFASDGTVDTGFSSSARGDVLVQDPDGLTVVALDAGAQGTVRRTSIGWDGTVHDTHTAPGALRGGAPATVALAAAQQSSGRIIELNAVGGTEGGLTRLTTSGAVDRTFGTGGVVSPPTGARPYDAPHFEADPRTGELVLHRLDESRSLSVAGDDRILVATTGPAPGGSATGPVVVRRFLPDGAPDTSWGTNGVAQLPTLTGDAPQVVAAPGGGVLVLAERDGHGVIVRLNSTGAIDGGWGTGGSASFVPPQNTSGQTDPGTLHDRALGVLPDGRVVAVGRFDRSWIATRLLPDGRVDTTYGQNGWTNDFQESDFDQDTLPGESWWPSGDAWSATIGTDGRVFVGDVERLYDGFGAPTPVVRVIAADGRGSDPDFAQDLVPAEDPPYFGGAGFPRVAVQADGRIIASFASPPARGPVAGPGLTTVRFESDGRLDHTYGDDGSSHVDLPDGRVSENWPTAVLVLRDGRSLVLGDAQGDAATLALTGGGVPPARRPVLRTFDLQLSLSSDSVAQVPLVLSAPSAAPVDVHVSTEGGGDRADVVDRTVTIPAGSVRVTIPVHVHAAGEPNEPAVVLRATSDDVQVHRRTGDAVAGATSRIVANGATEPPSPYPSGPPQVATDTADASRVRCTVGSWLGTNPMTYTRVWLRSGTTVPGESGETIAATSADRAGGLTCRVTATNELGTATATSDAWVPAAPVVVPSSPPAVSGGSAFPPFVLPSAPKTPRPGPATSSPATSGARITRLRLATREVTWRTTAAGRFGVRVDAVGSTVRAVRRARIAGTQWRSIVAASPGTVHVRLPRTLPAGRYRVRVYPGTARRGTPLATARARITRRR